MRSAWSRIVTLALKDAGEVRQQPGLILPALALVPVSALPGILLMIVVPRWTGEALADSEFAEAAQRVTSQIPGLAGLSLEAQAQAFLLQQFLTFTLLVPIFGSLSLAAQAIVGEKQARSLEPLLTTPLSVGELLLGKVLMPFLFSQLLTGGSYVLHLLLMLGLGEPGVWQTMLWPRTLLIFLVVGPLVSSTALLLAAVVSSRVNDARSAQQLGGLLVLPVTALFIVQLAGQFLLETRAVLGTALALAVANAGLLWLGIRIFQRETILMRWK